MNIKDIKLINIHLAFNKKAWKKVNPSNYNANRLIKKVLNEKYPNLVL